MTPTLDANKREYTAQEVQALFSEYARNRSVEVRNLLVTAHLYIAAMAAHRYMGRGMEYADLYQTASVALIGAVERYDPAVGVPFPAFAAKTVMGEIRHEFRDRLSMVHVSRTLQELTQKVAKARRELTGELGRAPYPDELAQNLHLPLSDILEAMEATNAQYPVSMDQTVSEEEDNPLADRLGREEKGYMDVETRDWLSRVMWNMTGQEREIIRQRYFLGYSQRQTAANLKVSQMYVSRLERKLLHQFREKS